MTAKGVLWDMDGVLVDTGEFHYQAWHSVLAEYGLDFPRDFHRMTFGMNNTGILSRLMGKDLTPESCVKALESIRDFDTRGLCGPVTFSATDHKGVSAVRLFKADPLSGKLIPITKWEDPPQFSK